MTDRRKSVSIYLDPPLMREFDQIVAEFGRRHLKVKKTQLGEVAIRQFVDKYKVDVKQLALDLSME